MSSFGQVGYLRASLQMRLGITRSVDRVPCLLRPLVRLTRVDLVEDPPDIRRQRLVLVFQVHTDQVSLIGLRVLG